MSVQEPTTHPYLSPHFFVQLMRYSETFFTLTRSPWQQLWSRGSRDWMREQEVWSRVLLALSGVLAGGEESPQLLSSDSDMMRSTRLISSSGFKRRTNVSVCFWRERERAQERGVGSSQAEGEQCSLLCVM